MEILLLWLDDLDDLVFTAAAKWRSACRAGLSVGLSAALVLTPLCGPELHTYWVVGLSLLAAGSVLAWMSAVLPLIRQSLLNAPSTA